MRICRVVCLLVSVNASLLSIGCRRSDDFTVIEPTENYQPTDQEKENQKRFDSMREQRD